MCLFVTFFLSLKHSNHLKQGDSRVFQERFKSVSRAFREGFKGVSRAYQGCVKGVSRGFRVFSSAQFQMGATSQKALNWSKIGATLRLKIRAKSELLSGGE